MWIQTNLYKNDQHQQQKNLTEKENFNKDKFKKKNNYELDRIDCVSDNFFSFL